MSCIDLEFTRRDLFLLWNQHLKVTGHTAAIWCFELSGRNNNYPIKVIWHLNVSIDFTHYIGFIFLLATFTWFLFLFHNCFTVNIFVVFYSCFYSPYLYHLPHCMFKTALCDCKKNKPRYIHRNKMYSIPSTTFHPLHFTVQ